MGMGEGREGGRDGERREGANGRGGREGGREGRRKEKEEICCSQLQDVLEMFCC